MHLRLPGVCCELNRSHTKGKKQQNQPAALSCRTAVCCSPFGPPQPNNATQFDANPPPLLQPTPRGFSPIPPWHLGPGPPPHTQRSPAPCLHIYLKAMPPQPCAHRNVAILASPPPPMLWFAPSPSPQLEQLWVQLPPQPPPLCRSTAAALRVPMDLQASVAKGPPQKGSPKKAPPPKKGFPEDPKAFVLQGCKASQSTCGKRAPKAPTAKGPRKDPKALVAKGPKGPHGAFVARRGEAFR